MMAVFEQARLHNCTDTCHFLHCTEYDMKPILKAKYNQQFNKLAQGLSMFPLHRHISAALKLGARISPGKNLHGACVSALWLNSALLELLRINELVAEQVLELTMLRPPHAIPCTFVVL